MTAILHYIVTEITQDDEVRARNEEFNVLKEIYAKSKDFDGNRQIFSVLDVGIEIKGTCTMQFSIFKPASPFHDGL